MTLLDAFGTARLTFSLSGGVRMAISDGVWSWRLVGATLRLIVGGMYGCVVWGWRSSMSPAIRCSRILRRW